MRPGLSSQPRRELVNLVLARALTLLLGEGWAQRNARLPNRDGTSRRCASAAIIDACGDLLADHVVLSLASRRLERLVGGDIPTWNDDGRRTRASVVRKITQAMYQ